MSWLSRTSWDRIISSRLSCWLANGSGPFIFTGYQKQPRHHAADDRRSQSTVDRALAIARIYLSSVSLSRSLSSRFFPVCFFFSIFPTSTFPRPSLVFSFFRVPACRTCVWIRFHAIPFDREERRKLFLEQPISLYPPSDLFSSLAPRIFDQVLFCFVSLSRLPKRGAEKKAINE